MSRNRFAFTLQDRATGDPIEYEGTLHPGAEGTALTLALSSVLGPLLGRAIGGFLVDGLPMEKIVDEVESWLGRVKNDEGDDVLDYLEEVAGRVLGEVPTSSIKSVPEALGDAIGKALADPRLAGMVIETFRYTKRNGVRLVTRDAKGKRLNVEGYDLAFRGRYDEMLRAFVMIAAENRFFVVWGTGNGSRRSPEATAA